MCARAHAQVRLQARERARMHERTRRSTHLIQKGLDVFDVGVVGECLAIHPDALRFEIFARLLECMHVIAG